MTAKFGHQSIRGKIGVLLQQDFGIGNQSAAIQPAQDLRQLYLLVIFGHQQIREQLGVQIQMHLELMIGNQSAAILLAQNLRQR